MQEAVEKIRYGQCEVENRIDQVGNTSKSRRKVHGYQGSHLSRSNANSIRAEWVQHGKFRISDSRILRRFDDLDGGANIGQPK
ncbi:hypothetical protein D3C87_1179770 [compost metagenome]